MAHPKGPPVSGKKDFWWYLCCERQAQRDSGKGEGASLTRWDSRWRGKPGFSQALEDLWMPGGVRYQHPLAALGETTVEL